MAKIYFPTFDRDVKINNGKELQLKEGTVGRTISNCSVGDIIYLPEINGNTKTFTQYILCEKTNDYAVLLRKVAITTGLVSQYQTWWNDTFKNTFSETAQRQMTTKSVDGSSLTSYLLSRDEVTTYFTTNSSRIAYNSSGNAVDWWTRQRYNDYYIYIVSSGNIDYNRDANNRYYRPAIVFLPNTPLNGSNQFIDEVTYTDTIDTIKFGDDLYRIKDVNAVTDVQVNGTSVVSSGVASITIPTPRLPSAYQEVEYIESSGTQYIDTLFNPTSNFKIVAELEMPTLTGTDNFVLFGSNNNNNNCYFVGGYNGQYFAQYGIVSASFFTNTSFSGKATITYDNGLIEITDGVTTESKNLSAQTHNTSAMSMYLFVGHNAGVVQGACGFKLYSFEIWNGGNIARYFVPCYHKDTNAIGLYDTVNNVFYQNAGTGTFTKGADV